jgi:transcriptional regulator with XRE-family HTH domain
LQPAPLRHLRRLHGWSRAYVAQQIDVSEATVASYEWRKRTPRLDHLLKIAELFELPLATDLRPWVIPEVDGDE